MARIRAINTTPELKVRKYLSGKGLRYRINYKLLGKPDIVFPGRKVAIFTHGCFWHKHGCSRSTMPKSNTKYWKKKLNTNAQRDKKVLSELKKKGWACLVIWECELRGGNEKPLRKLSAKIEKQKT